MGLFSHNEKIRLIFLCSTYFKMYFRCTVQCTILSHNCETFSCYFELLFFFCYIVILKIFVFIQIMILVSLPSVPQTLTCLMA